MRKLRKRDPFGVIMCWIMTLKDHATRLTCICALPWKHAHLVAYKPQEIFGVLGYPKIFHTDNGKEFTAKCVLELLRHLNPNILAVTGRPRHPRDQGSVENGNKLVKRVLSTCFLNAGWKARIPTGPKCWGVWLASLTLSVTEERVMYLPLKLSMDSFLITPYQQARVRCLLQGDLCH
jgi:transposase InsO family protein